MKLLKIENNQGLFSTDGVNFEPVSKLSKDHLLSLVQTALTEDFEMDGYDPESLKNEAHQIIYSSIYRKLTELHSRKDEFSDQSETEFYEIYEKYK